MSNIPTSKLQGLKGRHSSPAGSPKLAKPKKEQARISEVTLSSTASAASIDTESDISITTCDASTDRLTSHRDLSRCPCNNTLSANSWKIDCSECKQYWHVDCLSLNGLTEKMINKLVSFKCPLCWVSPIPTHKDETSLCYVCRNTQVLQQTNNQLELSMFRGKLESLKTVSSTLNSMDLDKFSKQISTLEELDMHVQHILLNQDTLEQSQKTVRNIDKNVDSMSSSMSAALIEQSKKIDDLESQIQNFTAVTHQIPPEHINNDGELLATIAGKLDDLYYPEPEFKDQVTRMQQQVNELCNRHEVESLIPTPSSYSDEFLESISSKLELLCNSEPEISAGLNDLKQRMERIENVNSQTLTHPSGNSRVPVPMTEASEMQSRPPLTELTNEYTPIELSEEDIIDENKEKELVELFLQNADQFKSESGHSVLHYGEPYKYNGSAQQLTATSPMPDAISSLIEMINTKYCSEDKPRMNSCLINMYNGTSSSLPCHADDEPTIHPESSIFTLSIGEDCTVEFSDANSNLHIKSHTCKKRSLYSMTRKSQDFFKHEIKQGSVQSGIRFSLTFRSLSWCNRNATCIIGDSNTCNLQFGNDPRRSFGKLLPGKQFYTPTIDMINPYFCAAYKNVVILCGINDIKQDRVKNPTDVKNIFNLLSCKIEQIQSLNPKAHVFVCPVLPEKQHLIFNRETTFNIFYGTSQSNHIYIFINIKV